MWSIARRVISTALVHPATPSIGSGRRQAHRVVRQSRAEGLRRHACAARTLYPPKARVARSSERSVTFARPIGGVHIRVESGSNRGSSTQTGVENRPDCRVTVSRPGRTPPSHSNSPVTSVGRRLTAPAASRDRPTSRLRRSPERIGPVFFGVWSDELPDRVLTRIRRKLALPLRKAAALDRYAPPQYRQAQLGGRRRFATSLGTTRSASIWRKRDP